MWDGLPPSIRSQWLRALALHCTVVFAPAGAVSGQGVTVQDSAGIRVVTSPGRSSLPVIYRLGDLIWDLGGLSDDPDQEWGNRGGSHAVVLSTGVIVVSDGAMLRYYDPSGRQLATFGREGAGPGEFRLISSLCARSGDTVYVGDGMLRRVTIIAPDRTLAHTVSASASHRIRGCLDDQVIFDTQPTTGLGDGWSRWVGLKGLAADGRVVVDFGLFEDQRASIVHRWGHVAVHTDRVALGSSASPSVVILNNSGRLIGLFRLREDPEPVTAADIKRGVGILQQINTDSRSVKAGAPPGMPIMPWPAHGALRYDPLGQLWMEDNLKHDGAGWTVFARTGEALGRFMVPKLPESGRAYVVGFTGQGVLLRHPDEDGAAHLTHYRLVRTR